MSSFSELLCLSAAHCAAIGVKHLCKAYKKYGRNGVAEFYGFAAHTHTESEAGDF